MAETVTEILRRPPGEVSLAAVDFTPRFTPRELEMIKEHFGQPMVEIISGDTDDKFVVVAWLKLRREGHQVSLEQMLDVVIDTAGIATTRVDPTSGEPSSSSPGSATTGG
jgi:hypothetical protein